jgi:hypothetical protein
MPDRLADLADGTQTQVILAFSGKVTSQRLVDIPGPLSALACASVTVIDRRCAVRAPDRRPGRRSR